VTLEQAAEIAALDPADIEWSIDEHGVCETEIHQITKLPEPPKMADEIGQSGEHERADRAPRVLSRRALAKEKMIAA
jgi:hypothetical protein